ncbi:mucin-2 [Patella vulgata]|uniref:mucin-2 n=1 Tax=Patella vulgata TaxID=6465 RepID=UPI00217FFD9E|nr:mucin-2 [Patella vulgata]
MKWRNLSWILLLTFTLLIKNCYCRGVLTIWLLNYRNIKGRTYDGSCCDAAPLGSSTCPDQCDYVMRCIVTGLGRANDHVFLFHRPIKYDSNDISFEDESSQMTQLTVLFDEWPAAGNVKMDVFFYDYDDDDHTTVLVDWFETPLRRTVDKGEKQLETVKGSRQLDKTILEFRWSVHCFGANDCLKPPPEWHKWPWQPEERTAVLLESSSVRTFDSTKHLSKANSYDKSTTTWNPNNKPSTVKVFNKQNSQEWEETKEHDWAGNSVWFNKSPFLPFHPFQRDRVAGETESDEALLDAQEHARIIDAEEREDLPAVKSNILDKHPSPSLKEKKDHRKHRRKKKKKKIIQETSDKKTQIISNSIYPKPYLTDKGIENTKNHLNQDSNAIENKLDKGAQAMVSNGQVKSNRSTQRKMKNEISHKPYHGLHSENLSQSAARDKSERIEKFIQITEIKSGAVQTVRNPYLQEPYRTINDYRRGKIRGFDRKTKILSSSRPTFHTSSNTKKLSSVSSTNSPKSILLQENVKVVQNDSNSKVPKIKQTLVGDSIQKPNKVLQSKAKSANNISTQNAETQPTVSASDINSLSQRPPLQERTGVTVKIQNDKRLDQHEIITKTDLKLDTKPSSDIISPSQLPPLQERTTVTVKEQNDKKLDKHKIITKTDLKLDTKPSSSNTRIPPDLRKGTTDISRSKTTSEIDIAKITGTSSRNKMVSSGTSKQTPNKPKRVTRPPPPTRKWDYNYDWKKHYKDYVMPRKRLPNVKSHAVVWTDAPPGLKKPNRRQRIGIAQTGAKRYPTKILNQLKEERKQHPSHYGYYRQKHNEFITEHNKKVKEQKKKKKLMELEKNSKGKSDSKLKLENPNSATHVSKTEVHSTFKKKHARTKTTTHGDQESIKENKNKKISRDQEGVADLTTSTPIPDIKYDYKHSDTPTKEISRKSTDKVGKQVESKSPYQRPTVDRNMAVEETGDIDSTRSDKIDPQINKGGLIKSESPLNPVIKPSQIYDRRVVVDPVTPRLNVPVNPAVLSRQTRLPYRANLIQGQGFTGWSDDFSTAIPPVNPSAIAPSNGKSSGPKLTADKSPVYLRDGIGSLKPTDLRPHLASKDRVVYNHMLKSSSTAYSSGQPDLANQNQDWSQLGISTKRMLKLDHSRSTPAINSGIKENVEPNNNDQTSVSGAVVRFDNQKSERDPPPFSNTNDQTSVSGEVAQLDNQKSERSPPPFPNTNDQTSVSWAVAKLDNQMAEKSPPPFPNTKGTGAYSKNGVSILNKNASVILSREQIKPRIAVSEIQNVNKSPFSPKPPNTKGTGAYSKNGVSILNKNASVILPREQIKPKIAVSEIQNVNKSPFSPKPPNIKGTGAYSKKGVSILNKNASVILPREQIKPIITVSEIQNVNKSPFSPKPLNTKGTGAYSKKGVSILNKNASVILPREQNKPRIAVSEIQNVNKSPFSPKPPTLLKNKPANKHGNGYQSAFASTTDRDLNELNWYTDKKDEKHSRQMVSRQDHLNVAKTINPMQSGHIKSSIIPRIETDSVTALVNKSNLLRNDEADTNSPRNPKIISQGISTTSSSLNEDLYQPKINDILESLTPGKKSPFKPKGRRPKGRGNRRKNRKQQRVHENLTKAKHVSTPGRVTLKTDSWKLTMFPSKFSSRQSVRYTSNDMTTQPFLSPVPTPTIPRDMHQHVMNLPTPPREDLTSTGGPQIPGIISSGEEITGSDKFTLNLPEVAVLTPVFSNRKTTTAVYRFKTKPPKQKTTKSNLAIFDSTTSNIGKDFKSLRTKGFSTSDPVQAISPPTNPRRFTPNDVWKSFKILNDLMDKASKVNIGNKNTGQSRDASIFKKSRKNPIQKLSPFNKYKPSTHKTVQHETTTPGTVRHSPKSIFTKQSPDKNNHFVIQNNGSKLDQPAKPFQDNDDTTSKIITRLNNLSQINVTPQPAGTFSIPSSQAPVIFFPTQNGKTVSTEGHMNIFEFLPNAIKNVYFGRSYSSANKSSATTDKSVSTPRLKVTASNEVTKKLRSPYMKVDDTGLNKTTPSRNQFILPVNNHDKTQLYPQANPGSLENQLTYDKTSNGETLNFNYHESEKNKNVENVLFQEKNASVARTTPQLKPDRGQPTDTVVRPTIGTKRSFKHQPETDLKGKTQHEGIFDGTTHRIPIVTSNKLWQHRISTKKNTQDPLSVGTWHNNKDTPSSNHRQYTSRDDDKRIKPNYISPATESAASDVFHKSLRSTTTPLTVSTNPKGYKTLDDTKHKSNFQPSPTRLSSMGVRVNTESAASDVFHKSLRSTTIPLTVSTNPKGFKTSDDTKHKNNFQPFPTRLSSMGVRVNTGTPSPTKFNRPSSSHASTTTSKSQSSSRKTATKRVRFHDFKTIHGNAAKTTNVNEMQTSNNAINEQRTTFRQLDLKAGVTTGKRGIHTTKTNFGYTLHSSTTNGNRRNTDQTRTGGTSKANVLNTTTKQIIHSKNTNGGTNNKAEVTLSSLTTNSTPINKISTTTTKGGLTVNPKSFNPTPKTKNETTKLNITSDIFKWIYDLSKSFPKRLNHEPGTGQKNHTDSSINLLTSSKNITTTVRGPTASSIKPPSTYISISPSGLSPKGETKRTEKSTVSGIYNATNGKARTEMVSLDTLGSSLKPTTSTEQSHAPTKSTTSRDNLGLFFGWSLPKEASPSTTTKNQSKGTSGTSSHTPEIKSTTKASRAVTTTKQNATSQPTLSTTAKTQPSTTLQPKKQNTTKTTKQSTNPTTAESTTVTTPKKILLTLPPWLKLPDPNKPKTTTQKPKTTQKPTTTSTITTTTTTTTTRKITKKVNKKTTKKSKKKVTKKTSKKTTAGTTTLKTTTTDLPNTTNRKPAAPKRPVNITINNDPGANNGPRIIVPNGGLYIPQPRDFNSSDGFLDFGLPGSSEARNLRLQVRKMNLKTVFSRYWPAILGLTVGTVFLVAAVLTSVACRQQRLYIRRSGWTDMPHHVSEPPDTSEYSSAASLVSDATRSSISFP